MKRIKLKEMLSLYPKIKWQIITILVMSLLIISHLIWKDWQFKKENPFIFKERVNHIQSIIFNPMEKEPFSLERKGENYWGLVSYDILYPSDSAIIKNFLSSLEEQKGISISENENSYNFNVVPSLIFYDKNKEEKEAFFLGERNTIKREIYLKRKSDNKVFLIPDIFSLLLYKGKEHFLENMIFPELVYLEPISLEIDIYKTLADFPDLMANQKIIFSKTKEGWKSNFGALPASANFGSLSNWRGAEILPSLPEEYREPIISSKILWANGEKRKIDFYDKQDNYLLLSIEGSPYAYWIDQAVLYQFLQF